MLPLYTERKYGKEQSKSPEELRNTEPIPSHHKAPSNSETSKPFESSETSEIPEISEILETSEGPDDDQINISHIETPSDQDPLKTSENRPCFTNGFIAGTPASIIFNGGAEINYVKGQEMDYRRKFMRPLWPTRPPNYWNILSRRSILTSGPYSESFRLDASPLNYYLILGNKWDSEHKATDD